MRASSFIFTLLFVATISLAVLPAPAAEKSGVGLSKISLPSGPGSIEGLGDSFEPQLNSGTSAYSVKIAAPPGVNGLQPNLVLRYNAGAGNSHFGLGWSAGWMCIQRQTEKGLPTYGPLDVFTFQGEELIPLADGTYRTENESGFMRFRRVGEGWEITDKSGTHHLLGTNVEARISRPPGTTFSDTFKWCVNEVIDVHGNRMEYHYASFPDSPGDIYCTEVRYSVSRDNAGIYHAIVFDYESRADSFASFLSGFEVRCGRRCREIRVESQGSLVRRYELSYAAEPDDPVEAIAPSDVGLAFSLLRKVTQFDNGSTGSPSYLPPLRFGYTRFAAADGHFGVVVNNPPVSLGNPNIAITDLNGDSLPDLFYTDRFTSAHSVFYNLGTLSHPMGEGPQGAGEGIRFGNETPFVLAPSGTTLDTPGTELADYDGDGHIDLVQKLGGTFDRFVYYPNTTPPHDANDTQPAWGPERSFTGPFPPFDLGDPSVRTLDLNGDKKIDFFRTTPWGFIVYYNRGTWWQEDGLKLFGEPDMGDIMMADDVSFSKPGPGGADVPNELVKLADMNGDRLLDLVRLTQFHQLVDVTFWPNKGRGAWGRRQVMTGTIDIGVAAIEDILVQDINGDGLADVVAVNYDRLTFWVNQGNNSFSQPFSVTGTPAYVRGETVLRQADINGTGSTDFVWENFDPSNGRYKIEYFDCAPVKPNLLRVIDNGIGLRTIIEYKTTTDYYVSASQAGNPWHTRVPFPSTVVAKLTQEFALDLDAVPGADSYITEFGYFDGYYDSFEKEFRGFAFAKKIERGDDRFIGTTNQTEVNSPSTITRFAFHTGVPDGIDNNGDGATDEFSEQGGYEEESIKGKPLWQEVTLPTADFGGSYPSQTDGIPADDAVVFIREFQDWRIKTIHSATNGFIYVDAYGTVHAELSIPHPTTDGKRVSFAFLASNTREVVEANGTLAGSPLADGIVFPLRPRKTLRTEMDVDFFGNSTAGRNYGEDSPGSSYDDERFSWNTYGFNLDAWLVGLPASQRVTDENGVFVSESRSYYDGADYTGLPLGQVGLRGLLMRQENLVNGDTLPPPIAEISSVVGDPRLPAGYAIQSSRNRYDQFGNLVQTRDPLYPQPSGGHERQFDYDPTFHTYVVRETIHVGGATAALVALANYDIGAGVVLSFIDFNNNQTRLEYDSFWRLVAIVKPGDSTILPTQLFEYRPGDPFRHVYYQYSRAGALTLIPTADVEGVSAVTIHAREQAGTENTFDVTAYTDGAGHKLGVAEEGETAGRFVYKNVKRYTSRGHERSTFLPFASASSGYQSPPDTTAHVDMFYDAASRIVRNVNPPETAEEGAPRTQNLTLCLPLETQLFDEEDANPASARFNTPHIQFKDGLDHLIGVVEVVKLNDDGTGAAVPSSWLTSYRYDLSDKLTRIRDSQGNEKWFRYDGLGRKVFMNDPDRGAMRFLYDDASNLIESTDAKGQRITYTYDGVNRILTEDYHDEGLPFSHNFTFNRAAPVSAVNRPDVAYFYDTPLANLDLGDGSVGTASNTKGKLAYVWDISGEEHTSYDARDRVGYVVKRIPDPLVTRPSSLAAYRTQFAYDSLDRVTTLTYPDNDSVSHQYNIRNLLSRIVGGPTGTIISNIVYQPSDQQAEVLYGNGIRTTYAYDPRLRLTSLVTAPRANPASPLIAFSYDFDGVSNIKTITDNRPGSVVPSGDPRRNTQLFQYDDLYRLTRAQYSFAVPSSSPSPVGGQRAGVRGASHDGEINYGYDRIGNMLAQTSTLDHRENGLPVANLGEMDSGGSAGRWNRVGRRPNDPPGPHALTSIRRSEFGIRNYPYDANGNMTNIDGLVCTWDFKDRLLAVENNEMRASYTYDYTDRRITKDVSYNPGGANFTNRDSRITTLYITKYFEIREHDAPTKYVWNGNTRVARVTGSFNTDFRVQRLRVHPGWNLCSLAVTATNAMQQLSLSATRGGQGEVVLAISKWDPATQDWEPVQQGARLPTGTVFWLKASTNATLTITGTYSDPTNRSLTPGVNFLPSAGLEAWNFKVAISNVLLASDWAYNAFSTRWLASPPSPLQSDLPAFVAPGEAVFVRADAPAQIEVPKSALSIRYYHQDHLGSSSIIANATGDTIQETENYPFGISRFESRLSHLSENYNFIQKERDSETGHYQVEARFLLARLARFASVDPLVEDQKNPYSYAHNNPVRYVDPTGEDALDYIQGATYGVGAGAVDTLVGLYNVVRHPGQTVRGVYYAATHIGETVEAVKQSVDQTVLLWKTGEDFHRGEIGGRFVVGLADIFFGAKGAGKIGGLSKLGKTAEAVELAVDAARKSGRLAAKAPATLFSHSSTGPRASAELLDAMRSHDRTIKFATESSDELRYLNAMGAEANVGGPGHLHILLRENPSKAAALEEFLHGTQSRLGIIDRLGVEGAEAHVKSFMQRHPKMLGLE